MSTSTAVYELRDTHGLLVAEHVREDLPDGTKQVRWRQPGGTWGLNGTKLADLPLYGADMVSDFGEDALIVVTEGEKARDALKEAGLPAVGTVTGAGGTLSLEALAVLRDRRVALWPDNDDKGRQHMDRCGERLQGIAAEVLLYTWHEAPEVWVEDKDGESKLKAQDAADHPAVQSRDPKAVDRLLTDLEGSPRWKPSETESAGLAGRVLIGERIASGTEPPDELVRDLIYAKRLHSLSSEPGDGKTLCALWAALEVGRQDRPVLYLDAENGPALIAERLEELGAEPDGLDEWFHYHPAPEISLDADSLAALRATIENVRPALAVFDSLPDFLALAGLDENSAGDVTRWILKVPQLIKDAGCAVLLLDHVTKSVEGRGRYARGSGAKLAKMDVAWSLSRTMPFDRERVGEITLSLRKDREAYLPTRQKFSVGGGEAGLVFARSTGTIEEPGADGLTDKQRQILDFLEGRSASGAAWRELEAEIGSKSTLSRNLSELRERNLVLKRGNRYHLAATELESGEDKPSANGSARFHGGSTELAELGKAGEVPQVPPPYRGGTVEPDARQEPDSKRERGTL